jgi:AbiTii/Transposase
VSKLSDIIDAAAADAVSVAALLRMTKVIAARMQTPPLLDWVDNELGGYPSGAPVPSYRGPFSTQVLSEWSGPFGSIARNVPVAPLSVPAGIRDIGAFEVTFYESVSELERIAEQDSTLTYSWPADAVAILNDQITRHQIPEIVPDYLMVNQVVIGIETDRGLWVGALHAAGYQVFAINPMAAAHYRDRHHVSGAKSDASDAKLLADLVRTDRHNPYVC